MRLENAHRVILHGDDVVGMDDLKASLGRLLFRKSLTDHRFVSHKHNIRPVFFFCKNRAPYQLARRFIRAHYIQYDFHINLQKLRAARGTR